MAPSCRHRHRHRHRLGYASLRSAFVPFVVALLLLTPLPMLPARAQSAAQAAPTSANVDKPTTPNPLPANAQSGAATDQAALSQPKSLTTKAIDKVKQVAK